LAQDRAIGACQYLSDIGGIGYKPDIYTKRRQSVKKRHIPYVRKGGHGRKNYINSGKLLK